MRVALVEINTLFCDLERALREQSNRVVALAWGVSTMTVSHWKAALGIPRLTIGSRARLKEIGTTFLTPEVIARGQKAARVPEIALRAARTKRRQEGHTR